MSRTEAIVGATLPVMPILIPLGVHFVLVSFVEIYPWLPVTYFFSHLVLFLVGLWACHDSTSVISAVAVIIVVVFTMLLDIIQLGLYFPAMQTRIDNDILVGQDARTWQFSAGMTIINLLFKPVTVVLSCIAVYVRSGGSLPGRLGGTSERDSYSTIHGNGNEN